MRDNALPADASQAEQKFLKAMDGWSRDSGAEITSLMPQWKNDSTNYMTLDCRVETSGELGALSKFIYDIEKGPMARAAGFGGIEFARQQRPADDARLGNQRAGAHPER